MLSKKSSTYLRPTAALFIFDRKNKNSAVSIAMKATNIDPAQTSAPCFRAATGISLTQVRQIPPSAQSNALQITSSKPIASS